MMQQIRYFLRGLFQGNRSYASEPEAALFKKMRLDLAFWYSVVMGGALVLFCCVIYLIVQSLLLSSVRTDLANQAQMISFGLRRAPGNSCARSPQPAGPPPHTQSADRPMPPRFLVACYDGAGRLLQPDTEQAYESQKRLPATFLDAALVQTALHGGNSADIVEGGDAYGRVYRYALVVSDPREGGRQGVVLVGESIAPQESALHILLLVLVGVGVLVLLLAILGGWLFSRRAMLPARLAFARQQSFIANASHELRTPLTFLCANTEILLEERERFLEDDVLLLEDIQTEALHMKTLANNMLTLARLDSGDVRSHREHDVLDLTALAKSAARQGRALANQRNIRIQVQGPERLYVIGDPLLLEQTVLVLLENAIKYNRPDGQVFLHTSLYGDQVRLEVQDTGVGIAPEHLPHLGERFYRVDKARSRAAGGTGLGLSIARGIVRSHGGSLQFASRPGLGTTVTMMLPATSIPMHSKKDASQALA